jgi:hypothetical protein
MKTGDSLKTAKLIRSQRTGVLLPRHGTFVRDIENLGRKLILVDFGSAGEEYLFPAEVLNETGNGHSLGVSLVATTTFTSQQSVRRIP